MREHPVPQDITGYKFHIIGAMTIKQFAMVAGGVVLAFLVNATNLPALIKWPIMVLLAGAGAAAAFVPIEEQPLDHWVVTFFKVLYKPTQYYWRRQAKIPEAFKFEQRVEINETDVPPDLSPQKKERVKEYLFSIKTEQPDEYELYEQNRITKLNQSFFPEWKPESNFQAQIAKNVLPKTKLKPLSSPVASTKTNPIKQTNKQNQKIAHGSTDYIEGSTIRNQTPVSPATTQKDSNTALSVPEQETINLDERTAPVQAPQAEQAALEQTPEQVVFSRSQKETSLASDNTAATTHNADLPFPSKPTIPNKIVGMILSSNNELINDAIVEIQKESGQVLRAVKSNSLGQFFISTPLKDGTYLISAEKNGFEFPQSRLILEGEIVEPIEIKSI